MEGGITCYASAGGVEIGAVGMNMICDQVKKAAIWLVTSIVVISLSIALVAVIVRLPLARRFTLQDEMTWVSVVGAVGGIVVGVVSLVVLSQIDKSVIREYEAQRKSHSDDINKEIAEKVASEFAKVGSAIHYWSQATFSIRQSKLDEAIAEAREALELWPELPGLAMDMADRLCQESVASYVQSLTNGQPITFPHRSEAFEFLRRAGAESPNECEVMYAALYGLKRSFDDLKNHLDKWKESSSSLGDVEIPNWACIAFTHAVQNKDQVDELQNLLAGRGGFILGDGLPIAPSNREVFNPAFGQLIARSYLCITKDSFSPEIVSIHFNSSDNEKEWFRSWVNDQRTIIDDETIPFEERKQAFQEKYWLIRGVDNYQKRWYPPEGYLQPTPDV